jgi:hypothetical protein
MEMGQYCKAYYARQFRPFADWKENSAMLRKEKKYENGTEIELERTELKDDDILYLQENYVVTDGIFKDQNIIFDHITDEWKRFCTNELRFEIPDDVQAELKAASDAAAEPRAAS